MSTFSPRGELILQKNTVVSSKRSQFVMEELLGRGGFGQVVRCQRVGTEELVAVKVMQKAHYDSAKNEVKILKLIRKVSPGGANIVRFLEHFELHNRMFLAFEMLDINLYEFMRVKCFVPLDVNELRPIAQQMLVALKLLKEIGVTHRDMKCDNIMLVNHATQPLRVKLIDFGLSSRTWRLKETKFKQPLPYRPPDVILDFPSDEAIDMWGLGCILTFLYLGRYLFPHWSEYETLSVMVKLLGQPHDSLLTCGLGTDRFFKCEKEKGAYAWQLKTAEDYFNDYGERILFHDGVHSNLNSLDDLQNKRTEPKDPLEKQDLLSFIDLLKQMLNINLSSRIAPVAALNHNFVTMSHLSGATNGPYVTACYKKMEPCAELESEAGNAAPLRPSDLFSDEESLDEAEQNSPTQASDSDGNSDKKPSVKANLAAAEEQKEQKEQAMPRPSSVKPSCRSGGQKAGPSAASSRKTTVPPAAARKTGRKTNNSKAVKPKPPCLDGFCGTESSSSASCAPINSDASDGSTNATLQTDSCDPIQAGSQISTGETRDEAAVAEDSSEEILQKIFDVLRSREASQSPTAETEPAKSLGKKSTNVGKTPASEDRNPNKTANTSLVTTVIKIPQGFNQLGDRPEDSQTSRRESVTDRYTKNKRRRSIFSPVPVIIPTAPSGLKCSDDKPEETATSQSRKFGPTNVNTGNIRKVVRFYPVATVLVTKPPLPGGEPEETATSQSRKRNDGGKDRNTKHKGRRSIFSPVPVIIPAAASGLKRSDVKPEETETQPAEKPSHLVEVKTNATFIRRMKNFFTRCFTFGR